MSRILSVFCALLSISVVRSQSNLVNNYLCTDEYCQRYVEETSCPILDESCRAQNSTLNGILLPSLTKCNCCEMCLENLKEQDDCTFGIVGAPIPSSICGPGLTCHQLSEDDHPLCVEQFGSPCLDNRLQFDFDFEGGSVGHLMERPNCDSDGDYGPIICIPGQICFCVDQDRNRIFGEALYTNHIDFQMKCECSRKAAQFKESLDLSGTYNFIKCDEMGSFFNVQCLNDSCLCVDPLTGSPTSIVYNITDIDKLQEYDSTGAKGSGCYDGNNSTLERPCEITKANLRKSLPPYLTQKDLETMCELDGSYAKVRKNETHYFCSDKSGMAIGNYSVELSDALSDRINCNCARVQDLLVKSNRLEFPQCDSMGNYREINCRRGYCYCVDVNGRQNSEEVPGLHITRLKCGGEEEPSTEEPVTEKLITEGIVQ